jgi:hypothetical protein
VRGRVSGLHATKKVEGIFAIEQMNDARALTRNVALLAGPFGDLVQMDIVSRVAAQNFKCLLLTVGVARSHPQQQTAVVQVLVEMLGMLVADKPRQRRPDEAAGAAGNRRRGKNAEQRTSGGSYCQAAEHGGHVDAGADDGALRTAVSSGV